MPEALFELSIASESTDRPPVPTVRWRVALPKHSTLADLYYLEFHSSDSAERIFEKLRNIYNRGMSTRLARFFHFSIFLRKIVIETASFETIDAAELESQLAQVKVHLTASNTSQLFTNAFHNPTLFRQPNFASSYPQFSVANSTTEGDLQTLVVRVAADKSRAFRVMVALLLAAPIIGVLVGVFSSRADVGVAVTTAIFAFVTCFQVSVHW
ncbi:MAG: hypothetical protein M1813_005500 [Trichoglossum hirsutum]|nr:MAG: hypothetical protein M1813_005500 [Trichoglossum hirsutum]